MQVEEAPEAGHEEQVLLSVRQVLGAAFRFLDASAEVGDVVAQRGKALAGDLLADEVADQEAQERLAFQWGDADRGACEVGERTAALSVRV